MLVEFENVRQLPNERRRRWFSSDTLELIVWFENDAVVGFQLCYDKNNIEKALTYLEGRGYTKTIIDDGDVSRGGHKKSPILKTSEISVTGQLYDLFNVQSLKIETAIRMYVSEHIERYIE
jgi:hypothetical protein